MTDVQFYFFLGCPWTYLAFARLRETAMRASGRIVWKPLPGMLAGDCLAGPDVDGAGVELRSAREDYQIKDLQDWACFCGLTIQKSVGHAVAAGWAMRGATVALESGAALPYCEAVFRSGFGRGADLDDLEVICAAAADAGIDPVKFAAACRSDRSVALLEDNSAELLRRGGFRSPTMFIGNDMYVGHDRMPLVELALGRAADHPLIVPGAHGQF